MNRRGFFKGLAAAVVVSTCRFYPVPAAPQLPPAPAIPFVSNWSYDRLNTPPTEEITQAKYNWKLAFEDMALGHPDS